MVVCAGLWRGDEWVPLASPAKEWNGGRFEQLPLGKPHMRSRWSRRADAYAPFG